MTSSWFFLSTLNYDARSTTHRFEFDVWHPLMLLYKDVGGGMQTQLCINKTDFFKLLCFVNVVTCFDFMFSSQYAAL